MKIHLDLDAFFVSAHRTKDKSLIGKPAVVVKTHDKEIFELKKTKVLNLNKGAFTGDIIVTNQELEENRGIIVTASYEAREFGIKTGMTLLEAKKIYPNLTVIKPDYHLYHLLSYKLKLFLRKKIPLIEQFSIDEFFGDLEGWVDEKNVLKFCYNLKQEIYDKFSLPISIGIAKSKWSAKLATSFAKPNGVFKVDDVYEFIKNIDIAKFPGIGKRIERRLKSRGILTLGDLVKNKEYILSWGKMGDVLYKRVIGEDNEEVFEREDRKSVGISRRFDVIYDREEIMRRIKILCRFLAFLVTKKKLNPTFYYLKIRYKNGQKSKAHLKVERIFNELLLKEIMSFLFLRVDEYDDGIVSISLVVSRFKRVSNLFDYEKDIKNEKLNKAINKIREKYGVDIMVSGDEIG
ncbi:Y-family DNA polymerase [Caminibacter mediatlanticus]|uniref:DNA-directed DNA polymerase n=1 Tax=Caminibacter mediatlanticus TB-2 TaxID=391592 RepID=A0AAI9AGG0_9BACT|nr:DNA polymerase IV [Caminibacter mediatlanticus]EDM23054.1 DNA-directed DNA polymerase [Caminibacter mediatlanticus TB-2]